MTKYVFWLRMRELYKRFVKTWIRFANPWIRTVSWLQILTSKRFVLCLTKRILDSYRIVDHKSWLKKIRFESLVTNPVNFQRFACFYESNKSLRFANPDSWIRTLKIRIVDSFRGFLFERFVLWIRFVQTKISNYSICFDSYTNPASLILINSSARS
jgi:hypothetical protein